MQRKAYAGEHAGGKDRIRDDKQDIANEGLDVEAVLVSTAAKITALMTYANTPAYTTTQPPKNPLTSNAWAGMVVTAIMMARIMNLISTSFVPVTFRGSGIVRK